MVLQLLFLSKGNDPMMDVERIKMCVDLCNPLPESVWIDVIVTQVGSRTFQLQIEELTIDDQMQKAFIPALAVGLWCKMHPELAFVDMYIEGDEEQNPLFMITAISVAQRP